MRRLSPYCKRLLMFILILLAFWFSEFSLSVLLNRGNQFFTLLGKMFPPDISYMVKILFPMLMTLQMSVAGTFVGAVFAWILSIGACCKIHGCNGLQAILRMVIRILRTIPVLVIALTTSFIFGVGSMAGIVAIALFTTGILTRMSWEKLDGLDYRAFNGLLATGNSRLKCFHRALLPQFLPLFLSDSFYALEINVRHAAILGYVGAGGIGLLLNEKIAWREYDKTGTILMTLWVVVILIEQISQRFREKSLLLYEETGKKVAGWFIIFGIAIILSFINVDWHFISFEGLLVLKSIFLGLLRPDVMLLFNATNQGVFYLVFQTLCISVAGTVVGAIFAIPFAFLGSAATAPKLILFPIRVVVSAVRTIPAIIVGLIFIRVTGPGPFAGMMTMAFLSFGMCTKMFMHSLEKTDHHLMLAGFMSGNRWWIVMRYYVWPVAKVSFCKDIWYRLDVNLRDAAVLGFVGAGGIGAPLLFAMNGYKWSMAGAYLLGLFILIFIVDIFSSSVTKKFDETHC